MIAMSAPTDEMTDPDVPQWYCLRSQPKHEHIAAAQLRRSMGIEVFCPRVRILLEFLGQTREIEVSLTAVFRQARTPAS